MNCMSLRVCLDIRECLKYKITSLTFCWIDKNSNMKVKMKNCFRIKESNEKTGTNE